VPTARWLAFFAPVSVALAAAASCGSRTGLLVPREFAGDASADVGADVPEEPGQDAAEEDAIPPLDVIEEPINTCADAGTQFIYVITTQNVLMSFYPPSATFTTIGMIQCPDPGGTNPFSMAVNRTSGLAYVVFTDGNLFRVTTTSPPTCTPTSFLAGQGGFPPTFGMGFSANAVDASTPETLYVAGDPMDGNGNALPGILASIDTTTLGLTQIGQFNPPIIQAELTGTGSGELFAFYATDTNDSAIGQIDRNTAQVTGQANLPGVALGDGWAFAFWGGDFYTFTDPLMDQSSVVTRYRPSDGSIVQVATTPGLTIVGAGVSTCAPQQ
jgi:hypothetical protein